MKSKECLETIGMTKTNNIKSESLNKPRVMYLVKELRKKELQTIKQDLDRLEILEKENKELKEENKILKEGIKSLLNYCDDLYLYEEKPYHITEEGIIHTFFDYEKEDLEKIKLMFEVLENENKDTKNI